MKNLQNEGKMIQREIEQLHVELEKKVNRITELDKEVKYSYVMIRTKVDE